MESELLETINIWASAYASAMAMLFATVYSLITPWWRTSTGRLIMMMMGGLAGLAALSLVFSRWENLDAVRMIRIVLVIVIGTAILGHVIALLRVQLVDRRTARSKGGHRS